LQPPGPAPCRPPARTPGVVAAPGGARKAVARSAPSVHGRRPPRPAPRPARTRDLDMNRADRAGFVG
jgi:hypothetical protein